MNLQIKKKHFSAILYFSFKQLVQKSFESIERKLNARRTVVTEQTLI